MHTNDTTRRPRRRKAGLAAVLIAGSTVVGALAPTPAQAATGTWEINNHRHYASDTQEVGSDEFYLATVWFRFKPGDPASVQTGRRSVYEIDDIDDGEYHSVRADMGQTTFGGLRDWGAGDFLANRGPEIVGTITQVMEADRVDNSDRRRVLDAAAAALKSRLQGIAAWTGPIDVVGHLGVAALADAISGRNMTPERLQFFENYARDTLAGVVFSTVNDAGIWSSLKTLRDDWIGSPKAAVFLSTGPFLSSIVDSQLAQFSTGGHMFGSMKPREWRPQYQGDGANYFMNVRTGQV